MSERKIVSADDLTRLGLDKNDQGGLGKLLGGPKPSQTADQLLKNVGPVQADMLRLLGRGFPYPLRDVVNLYFAVDKKLDDVVGIVSQLGVQNRDPQALDGLLKKMLEATQGDSLQEAQVGQPMQTNSLQLAVKLSAQGNIHIDFSQALQYLVLSPAGATQVAADIVEALIDQVAPDVDRTDAPPMLLFIQSLLDSAKAEQQALS